MKNEFENKKDLDNNKGHDKDNNYSGEKNAVNKQVSGATQAGDKTTETNVSGEKPGVIPGTADKEGMKTDYDRKQANERKKPTDNISDAGFDNGYVNAASKTGSDVAEPVAGFAENDSAHDAKATNRSSNTGKMDHDMLDPKIVKNTA